MSDLNVLQSLNEDQYNELRDSLALVTILIAGADGVVDEQELNWAEKLTKIRTYANPEELNSFYFDVEERFSGQLEELMESLPSDTNERQKAISDRLSRINNILGLLENKVAFQIYESLTTFAEHIAKASGGFLRFGSVSRDEKKWIELPMINSIILEEEDEEVAE